MKEFHRPRGTLDILPPSSSQWHVLEKTARDIFEVYGFEEIRTPIFEEKKLFVRTAGETSEVVTKQMFELDTPGETTYVLRPEGTAPVLRAFLEAGLHVSSPPYRYFYIGPMFRRERPQKGRYRQFHQIGIEVLNEASPEVDVEVIEAGYELFKALEVPDFVIELNSIGCRVCRPEFIQALRVYFSSHKDDLCDDCKIRLEKNPLRILDCKNETCRALRSDSPRIDTYWCTECRSHHERVIESLEVLHIPYTRNPFLVRGLDYYMRTTFEFVSGSLGAQNAVLGGGRYDGLLAQLGGPDWGGVGFALGIERLLELLPRSSQKKRSPFRVLVLPVGIQDRKPILQWLKKAREKKIASWVDWDVKSFRSGLKRAHRLGVTRVVIIGSNELESGLWTVKDMEKGEQHEHPPEKILDILLSNP